MSVIGRYSLSVSGNQQVIGSPCHLVVCHWSLSVATEDEDQQPKVLQYNISANVQRKLIISQAIKGVNDRYSGRSLGSDTALFESEASERKITCEPTNQPPFSCNCISGQWVRRRYIVNQNGRLWLHYLSGRRTHDLGLLKGCMMR